MALAQAPKTSGRRHEHLMKQEYVICPQRQAINHEKQVKKYASGQTRHERSAISLPQAFALQKMVWRHQHYLSNRGVGRGSGGSSTGREVGGSSTCPPKVRAFGSRSISNRPKSATNVSEDWGGGRAALFCILVFVVRVQACVMTLLVLGIPAWTFFACWCFDYSVLTTIIRPGHASSLLGCCFGNSICRSQCTCLTRKIMPAAEVLVLCSALCHTFGSVW